MGDYNSMGHSLQLFGARFWNFSPVVGLKNAGPVRHVTRKLFLLFFSESDFRTVMQLPLSIVVCLDELQVTGSVPGSI